MLLMQETLILGQQPAVWDRKTVFSATKVNFRTPVKLFHAHRTDCVAKGCLAHDD